MAQQIVKGDDLMVFKANGESMAYATQHTLTLNADSQEINTKDHGIYGATEVNKINWEITTENLYTSDEFDPLFNTMMTRQPVDIYWGFKSQTAGTVADGDYNYYTPTDASCYHGKAIITSLTANANTGENATFSATFTGTGKIETGLAPETNSASGTT